MGERVHKSRTTSNGSNHSLCEVDKKMSQEPNELVVPRFADNDNEAEKRFNKFKTKDPFPSIPSALLNSADIADYAAATGMIFPFEEDDLKLKSASYRIDILGKCVYWDEKGEKKSLILERGQELIFKPNSIIFVTVEPMFRIPDYIALRFNLQISHVYKGLLVGTGPLVDPGFVGKLSLPLHNLTANEYILKGGDSIIWMEFTKVSPNDIWRSAIDSATRSGSYRGFPARKNLKQIDDYLEKAVGRGRNVRSSIPEAVEQSSHEARRAADEAASAQATLQRALQALDDNLFDMRVEQQQTKTDLAKDVEVIRAEASGIANRVTWISAAATVLVLVLSSWQIILPTHTLVKTTTDNLVKTEQGLKNLEDVRVKELESQVSQLQTKLSELDAKLNQYSADSRKSRTASKRSR